MKRRRKRTTFCGGCYICIDYNRGSRNAARLCSRRISVLQQAGGTWDKLLAYQTHLCHSLSTGIRQLQLILFKVALILGVEIHVNLEFVKVLEPPEDQENQSIISHNAVLFTATSLCARCYVKLCKAVVLWLKNWEFFAPLIQPALLCAVTGMISVTTEHWQI